MADNDYGARIPFLLLNYGSMEEVSRRMRLLTSILSMFRPKLRMEFEALGIRINPEYYKVGAFFSALIYALLAFDLVLVLLMASPSMVMNMRILYSGGIGFLFFAVFFLLHLYYPRILVQKVAARSDKDLLFALREIMLSINSGVPLFDALRNVSIGTYDQVSEDFSRVVKEIESGSPEREALRSLVLRTESEYFKRALWQMINALETGASMSSALPGIVDALENHTYRNIRAYSSNLNFLMLIYMLVAAAIPSLGITFLVLLSAFSGLGVTLDKILLMIVGAAIGEILLIGYMSASRPDVFGG